MAIFSSIKIRVNLRNLWIIFKKIVSLIPRQRRQSSLDVLADLRNAFQIVAHRHIQLGTGTELDHPELFTGGAFLAGFEGTDDAAGDRAGDLPHQEPVAGGRQTEHFDLVGLVDLAAIGTTGIDKFAGFVGDLPDAYRARRAVDMHIKDA